jgi:Putative DNA-binding domain
MIPKPIEQITETDIAALISNAVPEGRTIEYKQQLPGTNDVEKKEFLADVSSFANSGGGDLILGLEEHQGQPAQIAGLSVPDRDFELRRLDSIIATGLEPRIRYQARFIDTANGLVFVVRVERSWVGPHRVIFKSHDKFYARNSAGKYPLDTFELRDAFVLSQTARDKLTAFRTERISDLLNNRTPVPFVAGSKIVLHIIPLDAFTSPRQIDVVAIANQATALPPMHSNSWNMRLNLDGVMSFSIRPEGAAYSYTQIYRTGILEVVEGTLLNHLHEGLRTIPHIAVEREILRYVGRCLETLRAWDVGLPLVVGMTWTGTAGLTMGRDPFDIGGYYAIDRDLLFLPDGSVFEWSINPGAVLKPMFDLVWNACGKQGSPNFDERGNWIGRS